MKWLSPIFFMLGIVGFLSILFREYFWIGYLVVALTLIFIAVNPFIYYVERLFFSIVFASLVGLVIFYGVGFVIGFLFSFDFGTSLVLSASLHSFFLANSIKVED